jgi:hypothetical protein
MPAAFAEGRNPTAQEIMTMQCPYLEASIEELFRVSLTAPACARMAMRDTTVLGQFVPKGTILFMVRDQSCHKLTVGGFFLRHSLWNLLLETNVGQFCSFGIMR